MSKTDELTVPADVTPCPRKSIKNLIQLYEKISTPGERLKPGNHGQILKPGSKNITETFENLRLQREEEKDEQAKELEKCVSVKSLVCNFQKMSSIERSYAPRVRSPSKLVEIPVEKIEPTKEQIPQEKKDAEEIDQLEDYTQVTEIPVESDLFQTNYNLAKTDDFDDEPDTKEHTETITTTGNYVLGQSVPEEKASSVSEVSSVDLDSDDNDILDTIPLGNGITPLPISYKVIPNKNGKLDLILPPPPEKSCLKTKNNERNIKFTEENSYGETYNMMEYTRADPDLDIVASTAEYEFEKMFERLEKIPVELVRKQNEKLGLQVYGVSVRKSSENNNMAIYVRSVTPGSLCERSGLINVDDLIIEINGESLIGVGVAKVHEVIQKSNDKISLLLGREPKGYVS